MTEYKEQQTDPTMKEPPMNDNNNYNDFSYQDICPAEGAFLTYCKAINVNRACPKDGWLFSNLKMASKKKKAATFRAVMKKTAEIMAPGEGCHCCPC